MPIVRIENHEKKRKTLEQIKFTYGVSGFTFYYRPSIMGHPGEWCCHRMNSYDDDSIELATTKPDILKSLLDSLLNLDESPNTPQIRFGSKIYNNLEDLWKAMGKT